MRRRLPQDGAHELWATSFRKRDTPCARQSSLWYHADAGCAKRLRSVEAVTQWHADWGLDDVRDCLRDEAYPIVGIERRFFGYPSATHAVVITAVQSMEVAMLDPLVGPAPQICHIATFAAAWRSAGQEALVLLSPLSE